MLHSSDATKPRLWRWARRCASLPTPRVAGFPGFRYLGLDAPVAQLDRALPSEGRGQGFESLRARHSVAARESDLTGRKAMLLAIAQALPQ